MNKQRFIDYLRSPERLTDGQFTELQKLLVDYPYFTIAKSIAARAAKDLDDPSKGKLIASAAIYVTDRKHLKKYINGELVFLAEKPVVADDVEVVIETQRSVQSTVHADGNKIETVAPTSSTPITSMQVTSETEMDQMIDELQRDMDELKKSRMHFVEIQNQLDQEAVNLTQRKVETKVAPPATPIIEATTAPVVTGKEKEPIAKSLSTADFREEKIKTSAEVGEKPKSQKDAPIKFDLESLKRELAKEVEEKEKEVLKEKEASPKSPPSKTIEKSSKEKPPKAPRVIKIEEEDDDEDMKEPPPVVNVPGSITNMSPAEENDDDDDADFSLPRRKSPRKPRAAVKIKREDLDKIIGKKASDNPILPEKLAEKSVEKPKLEKVKASLESEEKVEKPSAKVVVEKPKVEVPAEPTPVVSKVPDIKPEPIVEPEITAPVAQAPAEPARTEEPKAPVSAEPAPSRDEEPARNSIKAFLDLGISVERTSVSRASSSRSKRSARANRTRPTDEGSGDGKGDDESGGTGSLIDKFIQENPSIQRRQIKDEKADLSEDSGKWNPELASEYLAQIYLDQGNTKRAILIYETLSLKFPEKKSYFAGLIEKLKK